MQISLENGEIETNARPYTPNYTDNLRFQAIDQLVSLALIVHIHIHVRTTSQYSYHRTSKCIHFNVEIKLYINDFVKLISNTEG